ncbi:MAG: hypothetical protein Q8908_14540, partial [Bacteroidota bacterium]|nr:hypothetical protein [Bacteroidota bacterium]
MNRKFLNFIITLVILALITLVGIQFYWIRNAITVRETLFEGGVNDAVSTAINKLEKIEVTKQLVKFQKGASIYSSIDSLSKSFYSQQHPVIGVDSIGEGEKKPLRHEANSPYESTNPDSSSTLRSRESESRTGIEEPEPSSSKKNGRDLKPNMNRKNVEELLKQSTLLSEVFLDLFKSRYPEQ